MAPCNHEEADTRMMIHVFDACMNGLRRVKIRSNDTDVIILAISVVDLLQLDELWVSHGTSTKLQYLPAHTIANAIGRDKAKVLPLFHSITGCDTVSFFGGRGKKTAWDVWKVFPALTPALNKLMEMPNAVDDNCMSVIERFVTLIYDRTTSLTKVNDLRQELFSKKARTLENIPPTQASLVQQSCSTRKLHMWTDPY